MEHDCYAKISIVLVKTLVFEFLFQNFAKTEQFHNPVQLPLTGWWGVIYIELFHATLKVSQYYNLSIKVSCYM